MNAELLGCIETRQAVCDQHGEYESTLLKVGKCEWTGCPTCSRIAVDAENRRVETEHREAAFRAQGQAMFATSGVPKRLLGATFDGYTAAADNQAEAKRLVSSYAKDAVSNVEAGNGLILLGATGTGKTHLCVATIRQMTVRHHIASRYITAPSLMSQVKASYSGVGPTEYEIVNDLVSVPFLVIDEIGVGSGSNNETNVLFAVLGQRYDACLPTMLISNLEPAEFRKALGDRTVDRLRETSPVVTFTWASHRGGAA